MRRAESLESMGEMKMCTKRLILEPEGKDGFRGACGKTTLG